MAAENPQGTQWKIAAVVVAALAFYLNSQGKLPLPWQGDDATPSVGPDMVAVFSASGDKSKAKRYAIMAAEFFGSLARGIEADALLQPPRCRTVADLEDVRVLWRHYFTRGWSFDTTYPDFGNVVGGYLDKTCGDDGAVPLDEATRTKWRSAYRAIETEGRAAARKLSPLF